MSSFDDQVYNLKEALRHERCPRLRLPQDTLEFERRKKIAGIQAKWDANSSEPTSFLEIAFFGLILGLFVLL
jgi:hypothetical protein